MYVDFNTISEVVNRAFKIEYEKFIKDNYVKIKDFRNSEAGKEALSDIYTIVKDNILNRFLIIEKSFSKKEIESFLTVESLDFNDKALVSICKTLNLVLVTNDVDFRDSDIELLTANNRILNP